MSEVKTRYEMLSQQREGRKEADLTREKERAGRGAPRAEANKGHRWLHLHSQNQKNQRGQVKAETVF